MRADYDAIHHNLTPMKAVSARLTTKTAKALRLADFKPHAESDIEKQVPHARAQVGGEAPTERRSVRASRSGREGSQPARAKPLSDERLESRRNRNASKPRKKRQAANTWKIEPDPGQGD